MKCPVCGSKLKSYSYSDDIWGAYTTVESGVDCTVCDYSDFDSYGQYVVSFGEHYWQWEWNTPAEEKDRIQQEITQKLSQAKPSFIYSKYRYYEVDNDPIPF